MLTAFFLLSGAALFLDLVVEEKTKKVKEEDGDDGDGVDDDGVDDGYGDDDDDGYDGVDEEGKHLNMKHEDKLWRQIS